MKVKQYTAEEVSEAMSKLLKIVGYERIKTTTYDNSK